MHTLAILLALAGPAPRAGAVGIAWHRQATVTPAARQRLDAAVVQTLELDDSAVVSDAVGAARQLAAHEISRELVDELVQTEERMYRGTLRFRVGEFDAADAEAELVLSLLRDAPVLPGATSLAWRAHLLRARVAWTRADDPAVDAAVGAAIALDPSARLSTRRVPPDFAARYETVRAQVLAQAWVTPQISVRRKDGDEPDAVSPIDSDDETVQVEIDGRPGLRAVPPGEHIVVVRRSGAAPHAAFIKTDTPVVVPPPSEEVSDRFPEDVATAEVLCERLDLSRLVLARQRGDRVALEAYTCGSGFGPAWYGGPDEDPAVGLPIVLGLDEPVRFEREQSEIPANAPWPEPADARSDPTPTPIDRQPPPGPTKPWYKRAWVWVLIGGVVVAGVTTGAVLGTRQADQVYAVDVPSFLDR